MANFVDLLEIGESVRPAPEPANNISYVAELMDGEYKSLVEKGEAEATTIALR